ncbi:MAG: 5-formyltetrahydrofolate cyclo-ligase [Mariprofundaceae bacterium]
MKTSSNKAELRKQLITQRKQLSPEKHQQYSAIIRQQLITYLTTSFNNSFSVLMYYALPTEVDTRPLFEVTLWPTYAPRMEQEDKHMQWLEVGQDTTWKRGSLGVLEPEEGTIWQFDNKPTVLVCPMTGFDRQGNRLGMGKGCFDRWLDVHAQNMTEIIGLAFSCQESAVRIPTEAHDMPLNTIITEQEIITCQTH